MIVIVNKGGGAHDSDSYARYHYDGLTYARAEAQEGSNTLGNRECYRRGAMPCRISEVSGVVPYVRVEIDSAIKADGISAQEPSSS